MTAEAERILGFFCIATARPGLRLWLPFTSPWSMNSFLTEETAPNLETIRAAADLLQDPNPKIQKICEERLLAWGKASMASLEALAECSDPEARLRIRKVLCRVNMQVWRREFQDFTEQRTMDLEDGLLLLARLARPLLRIDKIKSSLDAWGKQLAPMLELAGTKKTATTLSEFFFWELGFKGDSRSYYTPDNCFLDQVIQRRRGIPISISAVYLLVGRRVGCPLEGVGLPGHFILRLKGARSVLLDPFHGGRILTRKECIERLQDMGYGFQERYFDAVSDFQMLSRVLGNLLHAHRYCEDRDFLESLRFAHQSLLSMQQDRAR